eukprot:TRINITY_DN65646_c0_g1_i1.p1 TRINITY_DN65646_c0_g1~~TRINITY_DN65646_c0_g1_i1.p1  ORF type:complete len:697 (+),score=96.84 TRINITY_DN65646_c0_g1_i1:73-2163(+)
MGFLHESEPLTWEEAMQNLRFVRAHGISQFLSVYHKCKDIQGDSFKWGDEVEHGILRLVGDSNDDLRSVRIALRSPTVLQELRAIESKRKELADSVDPKGCNSEGGSINWMPEYGRWMLESTPGQPFQRLDNIAALESSMNMRRKLLNAALQPGEIAPTVTSMPLFGTAAFCEPHHEPHGPAAASLFVPDEVIFPHPRFPTLTKNIRLRRGSRVAIRRPRYGEGDAMSTVGEHSTVPTSVAEADSLNHVYADAMAFGMGNCCLQVTMQASSISESRYLYDQLAPLTPILLALTAATPFLRGWICDDDTRWGQLSQSVDDRTPAERSSVSTGAASGDERLAGNGMRPLKKSRYDSIDCYIGEGPEAARHNDVPVVVDEEFVDELKRGGVDDTLAKHIAHLFSRDPLVLFGDRIQLDDNQDIDHWENLQSTNWQSLRWKPPPPSKGVLSSASQDHIGWRVEFRSMEVQMTDFENAAFVSFVVLLSEAIISLKPHMYIPMSKLEENMKTAQRQKACTEERFWFRTNVFPEHSNDPEAGNGSEGFELLTVSEILVGKGSFPGLMQLCCRYLDNADYDAATTRKIKEYLAFIIQRAQGSITTTATWMRNFVLNHEAYRQDSRVPAAAAHDLMVAAAEIGEGLRPCPELLGERLPETARAAAPAPSGEPRPCSCGASMKKDSFPTLIGRTSLADHVRCVCLV